MTQMTEAAPARSQAVDLVKTVAIFGVLVIHISAGGYEAPAGSADWLWSLFWGSVSRGAVPLFLMASGALLLSPRREVTLRRLYTKNFPRLLIALLFWAACYKVFALAMAGTLSVPALVYAAKEVVLFRHEEHLYYLHIMLLVYAFLPLTRLLARHGDQTLMRYALALWFALGIVYPTVKPFWPFTLLRGIPTQWLMNMTYASVGYTLLGYAMTRRPARRLRSGCTALAGLALTFGGTWAASAAAGKLDTHFLEGMSVGVCLLAAGLFGLCSTVRLPKALAAATQYISKASFCVFLVHIFFLKTFAHFGLTAATGPAIVTVPLLSLALLGCGLGVYAVLSRIPVVRSWLV